MYIYYLKNFWKKKFEVEFLFEKKKNWKIKIKINIEIEYCLICFNMFWVKVEVGEIL